MTRIFLFATVLSVAAAPLAADSVTIGTPQGWQAGAYTFDPAALQGFEAALGAALCQRAGLDCTWTALPPEALWPALAAGEIDAVMAGVSAAEDLGAGVERTMPYLMPDPFMHIGLPGTQWPVEGAVVAHLPDPAVSAFAATSGATFIQYDTLDAALAALRAGKVLSLFGERAALAPVVAASGGALAVVAGKEEIKVKPGLAMALRAADVDLRFAFEDRIYEMSRDGSLAALTETWFGADAAGW